MKDSKIWKMKLSHWCTSSTAQKHVQAATIQFRRRRGAIKWSVPGALPNFAGCVWLSCLRRIPTVTSLFSRAAGIFKQLISLMRWTGQSKKQLRSKNTSQKTLTKFWKIARDVPSAPTWSTKASQKWIWWSVSRAKSLFASCVPVSSRRKSKQKNTLKIRIVTIKTFTETQACTDTVTPRISCAAYHLWVRIYPVQIWSLTSFGNRLLLGRVRLPRIE